MLSFFTLYSTSKKTNEDWGMLCDMCNNYRMLADPVTHRFRITITRCDLYNHEWFVKKLKGFFLFVSSLMCNLGSFPSIKYFSVACFLMWSYIPNSFLLWSSPIPKFYVVVTCQDWYFCTVNFLLNSWSSSNCTRVASHLLGQIFFMLFNKSPNLRCWKIASYPMLLYQKL